MTKERDPLSIDAALARIAGHVPNAWAGMAELVGCTERHMRKWGDKDAEESINIDAMLALDLHYQENGGEGFPIYTAYGQLLETAVTERFVDQFELLRRASTIVLETGQAEAALLRCTLPGATARDKREALREILEAIDVLKQVVPILQHGSQAEPHQTGPPAAAA